MTPGVIFSNALKSFPRKCTKYEQMMSVIAHSVYEMLVQTIEGIQI
jgi:hypothetical protein